MIGKSEIANQKKTRTRHPKRSAMPMGRVLGGKSSEKEWPLTLQK
jgi:hypothetical protein